MPAYTLLCRDCGWWWEVYPQKKHWWSRAERRFRGPFWELREDHPKAFLPEPLMAQLYPTCYINTEWHSIMSSFRWRGILPSVRTDD